MCLTQSIGCLHLGGPPTTRLVEPIHPSSNDLFLASSYPVREGGLLGRPLVDGLAGVKPVHPEWGAVVDWWRER